MKGGAGQAEERAKEEEAKARAEEEAAKKRAQEDAVRAHGQTLFRQLSPNQQAAVLNQYEASRRAREWGKKEKKLARAGDAEASKVVEPTTFSPQELAMREAQGLNKVPPQKEVVGGKGPLGEAPDVAYVGDEGSELRKLCGDRLCFSNSCTMS